MSDTIKQPRLCFVKGSWAYFTTRPIDQQNGDDWDDAPYEHNAGEPYGFSEHDAKQGKEPWTITIVAWRGPLEQPCSNFCNSPWSVDQINAGVVAWLATSTWHTGPKVAIHAGVTIDEFRRLIRKGGGSVYTLDEIPTND